MPSMRGFRKEIDLGLKMTANDMTDLDVATVTASPGIAGTVVGVRVILPVVAGAGTLALAKGSTNILSATNIDLNAGVVGGTVLSPTLSTSNKALEVAATDYFTATWTLTTKGSMTGAGCTLIVEPSEY